MTETPDRNVEPEAGEEEEKEDEELAEAKEAAAGINEVRRQFGQDALSFDELGGRSITAGDLDK